MGPGETATPAVRESAYDLGHRIAESGWLLLTGGRNVGVMDAACRGAKSAGGLSIGILPGESARGMSEFIDIPIFTGMGSARNQINVLSSQVIIACGMGPGTASEIALAIKAKKPVILLHANSNSFQFFQALAGQITLADNPAQAIDQARQYIQKTFSDHG